MVGGKMLAASWLKDVLGPGFNFYLLGAVLMTLAGGVGASVFANRKDRRAEPAVADSGVA